MSDEKIGFINDSDAPKWQGLIWIGGSSFDNFKAAFKTIADQVSRTDKWSSMPSGWSMGTGFQTLMAHSARYQCPVEAEVAALRARADELEKALGK